MPCAASAGRAQLWFCPLTGSPFLAHLLRDRAQDVGKPFGERRYCMVPPALDPERLNECPVGNRNGDKLTADQFRLRHCAGHDRHAIGLPHDGFHRRDRIAGNGLGRRRNAGEEKKRVETAP
jgi:hypothetical protein